jgi:O-antigen/teichoic acid export membrane protein
MKLLSSLGSFTLINVASGATGLLLAPLLSHYLAPEEYGYLSLVVTYAAILTPFLGFNAAAYVAREVTDPTRKPNSLVRVAVLLILGVSALIFLPGYWWREALAGWLELSPRALLLVFAFALASALAGLYQYMLLYQRRERAYVALMGGKIVLEMAAVVLFVVGLQWGWEGRVLGAIGALLLLIGVFLYRWGRALLSAPLSRVLFAQSLLYGLPLIPHVLSKLALNQLDRIFIAKWASFEELGLYNLGYVLGAAVMYGASAFSNVYSPFVFRQLRSEALRPKEIGALIWLFLLGAALLAGLLVLGAPLLLEVFFDARYAGAVAYIPLVAGGYFLWSFYLCMAPFLFFYKKTGQISAISGVGLLLNLGLNVWLVPPYGAMGAAWATLLAFALSAALSIVLTSRLLPFSWKEMLVMSFKEFKEAVRAFK